MVHATDAVDDFHDDAERSRGHVEVLERQLSNDSVKLARAQVERPADRQRATSCDERVI